MFHKVKCAEAQDDFILYITFENGISRYYDIKPLFNKWDIFKNLKTTEGLYKKVKIDGGGYGISWNEEIDLSSEELWENGFDKLDD